MQREVWNIFNYYKNESIFRCTKVLHRTFKTEQKYDVKQVPVVLRILKGFFCAYLLNILVL